MTTRGAGALKGRSLYLCTPARDDLLAFVRACVEGGVDVVQLRDKVLEARDLIAAAAPLARLCADLDVPFIMNDRPDLALEVDADGVHVGQDDAPPALCRRILGTEAIIGLSTHAPTELRASLAEPVDYISAGPVVPTPTKPGRAGTGSRYVLEAAKLSTLPFFVTGGVTPATIPDLARAGARRFVVVRYLTEAADPRRAAGELRRAIDDATEPGRA